MTAPQNSKSAFPAMRKILAVAGNQRLTPLQRLIFVVMAARAYTGANNDSAKYIADLVGCEPGTVHDARSELRRLGVDENAPGALERIGVTRDKRAIHMLHPERARMSPLQRQIEKRYRKRAAGGQACQAKKGIRTSANAERAQEADALRQLPGSGSRQLPNQFNFTRSNSSPSDSPPNASLNVGTVEEEELQNEKAQNETRDVQVGFEGAGQGETAGNRDRGSESSTDGLGQGSRSEAFQAGEDGWAHALALDPLVVSAWPAAPAAQRARQLIKCGKQLVKKGSNAGRRYIDVQLEAGTHRQWAFERLKWCAENKVPIDVDATPHDAKKWEEIQRERDRKLKEEEDARTLQALQAGKLDVVVPGFDNVLKQVKAETITVVDGAVEKPKAKDRTRSKELVLAAREGRISWEEAKAEIAKLEGFQ